MATELISMLSRDAQVCDFHRAAVTALCQGMPILAVRLELRALELDSTFEEAETVIAWALKIAISRSNVSKVEV